MNIVLLGPPGSGKGTQGKLLEKKLNVSRLSVGALLRRHVQENSEFKSQLELMIQGRPVPGNVLIRLLSDWVMAHPGGFIIDNLIRSREQLVALQQFQKTPTAIKIDYVFSLNVSHDNCMKRIQRRRAINGKKRPDENMKAIEKRFNTFNNNIDMISTYFKAQNLLYEIDGNKSVENVHQQIVSIFQKNHDPSKITK